MPWHSIKLIPGVNTERTPTLLEAGYSSANGIRFKDGLAEKLGGWSKYYPFTLSGVPKALHAWQDLNDTGHLAVGATTHLSTISEDTLTQITPQTKTTEFAPKFSTTNTSTTVTVDDSNISTVTTYDTVYFATPIAVGGVILSGIYAITLVTGTTTYTITSATAATSSVTDGGAVPTFTTVSGSATITVTLTAHGLAVGDKVNFDLSTTVGGLTISGTYPVVTVPTANTFTITGLNTASSSAGPTSMNSGNAELVYYIALGPAATGAGYGLGTYGSGTYGLGTTSAVQTGTAITATDWTLDNWGEIIVGCPANGGIYYWSPSGGFLNAQLASVDAPLFCSGVFVSQPAQILVAFGSSLNYTTDGTGIGIDQDPLLITWSDSENFEEWTVSTTTQAGSYRIPTGSRIVGGRQGPSFGIIWTDLDAYAMTYINQPLVFGFQRIGANCGLAGRHAHATFRGEVYWMGRTNFFRLAGQGVEPMPCSVWDAVFQDLDTTNLEKIRVGTNTAFNEVIFFYPSLGGVGENDKYAKFNTVERTWDHGTLFARSAWIDESVLGGPIAASYGGIVYEHESGRDADTQPLTAEFTTGYIMLTEGQEMLFVDQIYPDMRYGLYDGSQTANVKITANVVNWPGETPTTYGPYTFTTSTTYIDTRFRGRAVSFTIESDDIGTFWRLGRMRVRAQRDGRQ